MLKNVNLETKPRITFSLHPLHEAFCRLIFNTPENQKLIILSRRHDIGKLIFGHIMSGDIQLSRPVLDHSVTFILPMPNNEHGYWLRYRFIYIPKWVEEKFRDAIEYEFKFWVKERFRKGYEEYNMDQETIIKAILRGLKVRNNKDNYEMIKKIDYRKRRTKEEIDFKNLLSIEKSAV